MLHRTHFHIDTRTRLLIPFLVVMLTIAGFTPPAAAQDGTRIKQGRTLGRGLVRSVAWSPTGDMIAVGGALGIWLYTPTLEDIGLLQGHEKAVYALAFRPDGNLLASASHDGTVRIWDVRDSDPLHVLRGHEGLVVAVDWHPSEDLIASGGYDNTVRLWNPVTGELLRTLEGHTDWVSDVVFSPDGALVASSSYDGTVRVWDVVTGEPVAVLEGHTGPVMALTWPNQFTFASVGWDRSLRRWGPDNWTMNEVIEDAHDDVIYDVAWSPQGFTVLTASWDGTLRNRYARTMDVVGEYVEHTARVQHVAWNTLGTQIATLGWDDTVRVIDITQEQQVAVRHEHMDFIIWLGWNADGLRALTLDGRLLVWDTESGELLAVQQAVDGDGLPTLRTHPSGKTFDIDEGGIVHLMQSAGDSTTLLGTLPGRANAATWSPDGDQLAVAARNGTITLWTVK